MSYVAEDVFFLPPGEPPVRGRDALRKWMTAFLAQYRTSSGLQPAAGGSAVFDRGNYMQVWKEDGDKAWKFAREVYNSSGPPAPVAAK